MPDDIGPDFPFKPTPPAAPATLKIEHDCGVTLTAVGRPLQQKFDLRIPLTNAVPSHPQPAAAR
jgi:hypothetical protein